MNSLELLFWGLLAVVAYSYAGYPLLLMCWSALVQQKRDLKFVLGKGGERRSGLANVTELPSVAVIISAYNEEKCIEARIQNLLALDYPEDKLTFLIGSDGSSDETVNIAKKFETKQLQFIDFKNNRGKASVLNDLVAQAQADVLVFSDANTEFDTQAVHRLTRHFSQGVDAVCGELHLVDNASGENQDGVYWLYERVLKFHESRIGGLLGANGAIYAIKKEAYQPIPADTVVDDLTIVLRIAESGGVVVYDPEARAVEEVAPGSGDEYKRRVRIGSGNYQAFHRFLSLLSPTHGALWFTYLSHKVLRWYTPLFLLCALLVTIPLALQSVFYAVVLFAQCATYLFCYRHRNGYAGNKVLRLIVFWVNMNMALGQGALRYYRGGVGGSWSSTSR